MTCMIMGLCIGPAASVVAQAPTDEESCQSTGRYTFSWSLENRCGLEPRGGTSTGAPVTLDPDPHPGWLALQEEGLSDRERDRRAILAMAGPYRTSFEFLEVAGYTPAFERARPYQSWSTEYVYVVEDREDFISLQHIIVMFMQGDDGEVQGPFVQKHWRQDWAWEKPRIFEFIGNDRWQWRDLPAGEYQGTWAQSVYQVDDAPRYESWGKWQHYPNFSTWISEDTWRPLPRRESSVRDDYQVLEGRNRHTITHNGWIHEEENYKLRLDDQGNRTDAPYLAKELGLNRYERIVDFDFSAGDQYWQDTGGFWQVVRELWQEYFEQDEQFSFSEAVDGMPLFAALFQAAAEWQAEEGSAEDLKAELRTIMNRYIE